MIIMIHKIKLSKKDVFIALCCIVFLLMNLGAIGNTNRRQAKTTVCQTNLKKMGQIQFLYLNDNDNFFPPAWNSLVSTENLYTGYPFYCRWHDSRYPPNGPLMIYLEKDKIALCPAFNDLARQFGQNHPAHDPSIPVEPQYSYSMNGFLGSTAFGGVLKFSDITRNKAEVFLFAEENIWLRPGCIYLLNDTALCPDGRDWFGTFHNAPNDNLNAGSINAVFVDGHVQQVCSALKVDFSDTSEMEFGRFEKYGWPFKELYR
jgi:prepilin-type processing-associated H-X9-DG protein